MVQLTNHPEQTLMDPENSYVDNSLNEKWIKENEMESVMGSGHQVNAKVLPSPR